MAHYAPTHLCRFPVRVYQQLALAAFLGSVSSPLENIAVPLRSHRGLRLADLPTSHLDVPSAIAIERGRFYEASLLQLLTECRNINLLCIGYAVRPRLSSRLTLGRFSLPRKPWVYGERDSHPFSCYLCLHSHFATLHHGSPHNFSAMRMLPYRLHLKGVNPQLRCVV